MRRRSAGDALGRPPVPARFLRCDYREWFDASERVPPETGADVDEERRATYRGVAAERRWNDAAIAWAAEHGYSRRELYRAQDAARGPVVDGPGVVRP